MVGTPSISCWSSSSALRLPQCLYKAGFGSFDTHHNQLGTQARLLAELADTLDTFAQLMKKTGHWDQVLVMTYSEFGRRVAQNGSQGTDHGTANVHLLAGGQVKGGHHGQAPNLGQLIKGNPAHTTDFRQLYRTLAQQWWQVPQLGALSQHPILPLFS